MATANGTLVGKVSSTVSSPTVNYSASYSATRADSSDDSVSVTITFSAWLNSSVSKLGTGTKLTIYTRMNGGPWNSVVMKSASASWSGTSMHSASIQLSGNVLSGSTKIDFYVTRSGSTYSGNAGNLGNASNPKSYTATMPAYGGIDPADADKYVHIKAGGQWKQAVPYVKVSGTWKKTIPYMKASGIWKST